jgi:hypothetical protein
VRLKKEIRKEKKDINQKCHIHGVLKGFTSDGFENVVCCTGESLVKCLLLQSLILGKVFYN